MFFHIAQKCRDLLTNPLFVQQIAVLVLGNGNGVIDFPEFCKFYLPLGSDKHAALTDGWIDISPSDL